MNRTIAFSLLFVLTALFSIFLTTSVYKLQNSSHEEIISEFAILPPSALEAFSFEFKGVVSDYLFLKTITFIGNKIGQDQPLTKQNWQQVYQILQRITDLDPFFWDPYLFAEMMLAWQAGMLNEADELLQKACRYRDKDYRPFYYLGFNQFYFKKDAPKAAEYLRLAAKRPGAPYFLTGLAARLSLYGNQTAAGIIFLENLLRESRDPKVTHYLKKRLLTLKIIYDLERKVREYKEKFGNPPETLQDLVTKGLIPSIPEDPYGGAFLLLKNGRVYTTSEMVERKK